MAIEHDGGGRRTTFGSDEFAMRLYRATEQLPMVAAAADPAQRIASCEHAFEAFTVVLAGDQESTLDWCVRCGARRLGEHGEWKLAAHVLELVAAKR
jgi:hypothetical protein